MPKSLIFCLSILLFQETTLPCTTVVVGRNLTADGSIIHAHNEDMGVSIAGRLWHVSSKNYNPDEKVRVPYMEIPQSSHTYAYWASGNARDVQKEELSEETLPYDNILVGMNEHGLTMSCNWAYSKEENLIEKGIRRYAIRQMILERCSTAEEAVKLIGGFIETYGQADWGGLIYVLADPNSGWIVETTSNHWVARKLHNDEIIIVANRFQIGHDYDLASSDIIEFAEEKGWYNQGDGAFNFNDTYGFPPRMNEQYDIERENRVVNLLEDKKGRIVPSDLMIVLRDRYYNTPAYTPPTEYEPTRISCNELGARRPICTNLCQSSFVAHLRKDLPVAVGSVLWYTMATPAYSSYFPLYAGTTRIPGGFSHDSAKNDRQSVWWKYRMLQLSIDQSSEENRTAVRKLAKDMTANIMNHQEEVEREVLELLVDDRHHIALSILNRYTAQSARMSIEGVRKLLGRNVRYNIPSKF